MKRSIKSLLLIVGIIAAGSSLTSCNKQCACIHNNGSIVYFSKSEVEDSNGGNCSGMKYQSGVEYFAVCDWE